MPLRLLALLLLLAVLPTVEVVEQAVHVVAHVIEGESPGHSAHHEATTDEHGCTPLVHLCSCHQSHVTPSSAVTTMRTVAEVRSVAVAGPPRSLFDLASQEPAYRPPIA